VWVLSLLGSINNRILFFAEYYTLSSYLVEKQPFFATWITYEYFFCDECHAMLLQWRETLKESLSLKSVVGANEMEAIYLNYLSPTFLLEYIQVKE